MSHRTDDLAAIGYRFPCSNWYRMQEGWKIARPLRPLDDRAYFDRTQRLYEVFQSDGTPLGTMSEVQLELMIKGTPC